MVVQIVVKRKGQGNGRCLIIEKKGRDVQVESGVGGTGHILSFRK